MLRPRHLFSGCALAVGAAAVAQSPYAQPQYSNPFAPPSDADRLAQQLRVVAANPTDLYALIGAAKLSLQVGDIDAAAALFTRADRINPQHPQVKAGMARLLVQVGRPGEALRRFQEAQSLGATLADFGPDRALAYDLIGEQPRAQREYRALLKLGADDEATRRYALSLGISGLKDQALALLEPLNRRGDRGAWRARAFVLAMTGDRSGAERIATTMMPAGMAAGLDPFFDRLPRLTADERAFAVNFGETRASPARLADARLVPQLPALSPEPDPFPKARTAALLAVRDDSDAGRKGRRSRRDRPAAVRIAAQPYVAPLPAPPAPTAAQLASLTAVRMAPGSFMAAPAGRGARVLPPPADAYRSPVAPVVSAGIDSSDEPDFAVAAVAAVASAKPPSTTGGSSRIPVTPVQLAATVPGPDARPTFIGVPSAEVSSFTLVPAAAPPPAVAVAGPSATSLAVVAETVSSTPAGPSDPLADRVAATEAVVAPPAAVAAITPATGPPPAATAGRGDTVLAAIVAGITVPEAELAATPAVAAPVRTTGAARPSRLLVNVEKTAAADRARIDPKRAERVDPDLPRTDSRGRFEDARGKPLLDARGRPLDRKAALARLAAAANPKQADRAEPQRYWVQVAGGANAAALAKEWTRVAGQAASLKGRSGWTTPLRATNRVLTGPFKTGAEAMAMVNRLKNEGVSAFMFTSDPGQKVTRLGGK